MRDENIACETRGSRILITLEGLMNEEVFLDSYGFKKSDLLLCLPMIACRIDKDLGSKIDEFNNRELLINVAYHISCKDRHWLSSERLSLALVALVFILAMLFTPFMVLLFLFTGFVISFREMISVYLNDLKTVEICRRHGVTYEDFVGLLPPSQKQYDYFKNLIMGKLTHPKNAFRLVLIARHFTKQL